MNQLNSVIVEGNVVREPVLKEPVKDFKVCAFSVAVNRWYKTQKGNGEEEVSFFEIETYNRMAEVCMKKLTKGLGVRVVGRLKQDRWEDESGKSHSKVYVIAEHVEFRPLYLKPEQTAGKEVNKESVVDSGVKASNEEKTVEENNAETEITSEEKVAVTAEGTVF